MIGIRSCGEQHLEDCVIISIDRDINRRANRVVVPIHVRVRVDENFYDIRVPFQTCNPERSGLSSAAGTTASTCVPAARSATTSASFPCLAARYRGCSCSSVSLSGSLSNSLSGSDSPEDGGAFTFIKMALRGGSLVAACKNCLRRRRRRRRPVQRPSQQSTA